MKKLVLALVCLVSVAFFASCKNEVGDPTIQVYTEEGCVVDGANVDIDTPIPYGFKVASDAISGKELKSLVISVDGDQRVSVDLTGMTSYTFIDTITYGLEKDGILLGQSTISAILTDGNNRTATANITLNVYNPAQPLVTKDFEWIRHGGVVATGLDEFGLYWNYNGPRENWVRIEPKEGTDTQLFIFDPSVWDNVTTDTEKAALFSDTQLSVANFRGVSCDRTQDYNLVIGTVYNGQYHLMHITKGIVSTFKGTEVIIQGQHK